MNQVHSDEIKAICSLQWERFVRYTEKSFLFRKILQEEFEQPENQRDDFILSEDALEEAYGSLIHANPNAMEYEGYFSSLRSYLAQKADSLTNEAK